MAKAGQSRRTRSIYWLCRWLRDLTENSETLPAEASRRRVFRLGFDSAAQPSDNRSDMRKALRRTTRPVAAAMSVLFALVLSVSCFARADMTAAEKACCAAMAHDCSAMAQEQSCCVSDAPTLDQLAAAKKLSLKAPASVSVSAGTFPHAGEIPAALGFSAPRALPRQLAFTPKYLLLSALLI